MPKKRLSMRKIKEILKLKFERGFSIRAIARSISASPSTVMDCLLRAEAAGIRWPVDPRPKRPSQYHHDSVRSSPRHSPLESRTFSASPG